VDNLLHKRLILAILLVLACLPVVVSYTPVHATTMANNTATSNFSIRQNPTTSVWTQGTFNYVGCVRGDNDTRYGIGIRFSAVAIPHGATIDSAHLVATSASSFTQDTVNSMIQGEYVDSAAAFSTVANYQGRTRTPTAVAWNGIEHWTMGTQYSSPDISEVIEEIVGRAGWVSGNNMVLFWDDHLANSSQGSYTPPCVRGGSSYLLMVEYTAATTVSHANVTTKDATDIGSSTAVLNAYVDEDGGDTNGVALQFGYANATHAANFAAYTHFTAWSTSNYTTGEAYNLAVGSLTPSTTYYFNTQGQNSVGYTYGVEQTFVTPASSTVLTPSNFIILPSSTSVDLQWSKPAGFSESRLYFKSGSIPSSNTTVDLLYSGVNNYYTHSSLTSGTTYGYLLYGYESGIWSASASGIITTKGTSTGTGFNTPTVPTNWFIDTEYTTQNTTFYYDIVNNLADSFSMPRNTAWATWALCLAMFLGFLIWSASRSMVATTGAVCVGVIIGSLQHLIPMYMMLLVLVFGISIIAVRERI